MMFDNIFFCAKIFHCIRHRGLTATPFTPPPPHGQGGRGERDSASRRVDCVRILQGRYHLRPHRRMGRVGEASELVRAAGWIV